VSWLVDTLQLYARVFRRGATLLLAHWWLGVVGAVYPLALLGVAMVVAPLGIMGGFLVTLVAAAFASSWLVLVAQIVRNGRATFAEVPASFGTHLGDVVTFLFLLWALRFVVGVAVAQLEYLVIVFQLALLVFLSAVPEEIALADESGAAVFVESYRFVAAHWIEWLPAAAVLLIVWAAAASVPLQPAAVLAGGGAGAFMFIVRGLLFLELTSSSRRAREFQRRAAP